MDVEETDLRSHVNKARAGDVDAWEWLYRRTYPRLFGYARRRLNSEPAADDVVSETMIRALDKISGFEWRGAGFDGWLFAICRNIVLETYRSNARLLPVEQVPDQPDPDGSPADRLEASQDRERLLAAFTRLEADEQEILELRVVAGLTSEDAAEVLGKRPGAVRMAQSRALARLRTYLNEVNREQ